MNTKQPATELYPSEQLPTFPCSLLKSIPNEELYNILDTSPIRITRYNKLASVLMSVEIYNRLADKISLLESKTKH